VKQRPATNHVQNAHNAYYKARVQEESRQTESIFTISNEIDIIERELKIFLDDLQKILPKINPNHQAIILNYDTIILCRNYEESKPAYHWWAHIAEPVGHRHQQQQNNQLALLSGKVKTTIKFINEIIILLNKEKLFAPSVKLTQVNFFDSGADSFSFGDEYYQNKKIKELLNNIDNIKLEQSLIIETIVSNLHNLLNNINKNNIEKIEGLIELLGKAAYMPINHESLLEIAVNKLATSESTEALVTQHDLLLNIITYVPAYILEMKFSDNLSPQEYAIKNNNIEFFKILLERQPPISLHQLAKEHEKIEFLKLAIEHANADSINEIKMPNFNIFRPFETFISDVFNLDKSILGGLGDTPLKVAYNMNNIPLINLLEAAGAKDNIPGSDGVSVWEMKNNIPKEQTFINKLTVSLKMGYGNFFGFYIIKPVIKCTDQYVLDENTNIIKCYCQNFMEEKIVRDQYGFKYKTVNFNTKHFTESLKYPAISLALNYVIPSSYNNLGTSALVKLWDASVEEKSFADVLSLQSVAELGANLLMSYTLTNNFSSVIGDYPITVAILSSCLDSAVQLIGHSMVYVTKQAYDSVMGEL
jgi:hypothetical protein